jgi:hypothetical protein
MRIACLHTADSNVTVFNEAANSLSGDSLHLSHTVRSDLLAAAEDSGGLTKKIIADTQAALRDLCANHDAVLLTCSTLGPAVYGLSTETSTRIIRADEALARQAVSQGGRLVVLCTADTTVKPTSELFHGVPRNVTSTIEIQLIPNIWSLFKTGDLSGYFSAIATAADNAYLNGANVVAFAQASMANAAALVKKGPPPLASPLCGLRAALQPQLI